MKILVVKLTSMGDALHLLPALSDLKSAYPEISVDWMIEESFAEIPQWHPSVDQVIPVATRRWRKLARHNIRDFLRFWRQLRQTRYDAIIDAQGLIKSAVFARFAKLAPGGRRIGYSAASIKERPAAKLYRERINVARDQHAIARLRSLFGQAFNYAVAPAAINYGLRPSLHLGAPATEGDLTPAPTIAFLHGTTWASKHLPNQYWRDLLILAAAAGYQVKLPWGNAHEKERAEWIAEAHSNAQVLAKSNLLELAGILRTCSGAIAVDTGLGHLAAALGLPTVSVYGATNAKLTGAVGEHQQHLQSTYPCSPCLLKQCDKLSTQVLQPPCYSELAPATIWNKLHQQLI